jgi:hypothetical protein
MECGGKPGGADRVELEFSSTGSVGGLFGNFNPWFGIPIQSSVRGNFRIEGSVSLRKRGQNPSRKFKAGSRKIVKMTAFTLRANLPQFCRFLAQALPLRERVPTVSFRAGLRPFSAMAFMCSPHRRYASVGSTNENHF